MLFVRGGNKGIGVSFVMWVFSCFFFVCYGFLEFIYKDNVFDLFWWDFLFCIASWCIIG